MTVTTCLMFTEHTFIVLANLYVTTGVQYIGFFHSLYDKLFIEYSISLDGGFVLAY